MACVSVTIEHFSLVLLIINLGQSIARTIVLFIPDPEMAKKFKTENDYEYS
jgi:hypothetical protein